MESLNILHLSDFHIGNFRYQDSAILAINIADNLVDHGRKIDVVVVSGDVFDGRSSTAEFDIKTAIRFFKIFITQVNSKKLSDNVFDENCILFVPGNHDLVRDPDKQYDKYDSFIKEFYPSKSSNKTKMIDGYNFICDFPDKKIAILGFNSCRIEIEEVKEKELKWIDEIDLSSFSDEESKIKKKIKELKAAEKKWDDYGYINPIEMDNVFNALREEIPSYHDYNIVATFHHHFYPFPEIIDRNPDSSCIRNHTYVLDKFQRYKVKLVLHGHKHSSIQRAITDNKYFDDPESIIYVLSAGSVGCKDVYTPSYQWVRVFDKSFTKLAEGEKYDFKDEELDNVKAFILPPEIKEEKSAAVDLLDTLQIVGSKYYLEYIKVTDDFEQAIQDSGIKKILEVVASLLTIFNDIKLELRKKPELIYTLLLSLNYRVIFLKNANSPSKELIVLLERLKVALVSVLGDTPYSQDLISFISSTSNNELDKNYSKIIKNVLGTEKRISAYTSISLFFTDLFLNISQYGEFYFDKENLKHKINIKLGKDLFYKNIPNDSISVEGDIDRRAIILNFKCKDPTVHKVAVLIVKDFEMRLNKFEESLKEVKLKLYYLLPKVQPDKYDLENFHFEAYIPTLLPLLTGDNLYKQKEVFIRELVQNAIDATLLRQKIDPINEFNTDINIELGTETRNGSEIKYFRITDSGIGMSKFSIERYFTSIGRSFYVSEEFDDLKEKNNIQYNAISNFGIGFLSSFMVCQAVMVKTKNLMAEDGDSGLEIEIPNYDGCFFIRKIDQQHIGTEITLYEDDRGLFNFQKFEEYIKSTFLGLPLNLNVIIKGTTPRKFCISSYKLQRDKLDLIKKKSNILFYIPFSEDLKKPKEFSWEELQSSDSEKIDKYGIWFDFSSIINRRYQPSTDPITSSNQGLKISEKYLPLKWMQGDVLPSLTVNYPSSFIQLDVAREKVVKLKDNVELSSLPKLLEMQVVGFLKSTSDNLMNSSIHQINTIQYVFLRELKLRSSPIFSEAFTLKINKLKEGISLSIIKIKEIPADYDETKVCFWNFQNHSNFFKFFNFFTKLNIPLEVFDYTEKVNFDGNVGKFEMEYREFMEFMHSIGIGQVLNMIKHTGLDGFIDNNNIREHRDIYEIMERMEAVDVSGMIGYNGRGLNGRRSNVNYIARKAIELNERTGALYSTEGDEFYELFNLLFSVSSQFNRHKERRGTSMLETLFSSLWIFKSILFEKVKVKDYIGFEFKIDFDRLLKNKKVVM